MISPNVNSSPSISRISDDLTSLGDLSNASCMMAIFSVLTNSSMATSPVGIKEHKWPSIVLKAKPLSAAISAIDFHSRNILREMRIVSPFGILGLGLAWISCSSLTAFTDCILSRAIYFGTECQS
ncbi:MAG TPA: hypothetical protein VK921_18785 [Anditalea sp.]|nr:hypothetical protein [Anditalea sp.]